MNTPGTRGWSRSRSRLHNRTLAVKRRNIPASQAKIWGETNFESQELSFLNNQNFHLRGEQKIIEGAGSKIKNFNFFFRNVPAFGREAWTNPQSLEYFFFFFLLFFFLSSSSFSLLLLLQIYRDIKQDIAKDIARMWPEVNTLCPSCSASLILLRRKN